MFHKNSASYKDVDEILKLGRDNPLSYKEAKRLLLIVVNRLHIKNAEEVVEKIIKDRKR